LKASPVRALRGAWDERFLSKAKVKSSLISGETAMLVLEAGASGERIDLAQLV
jgi:hypothetical protein